MADRVADGPRPVQELAEDCGADADALRRVLRTLAAGGLFMHFAGRERTEDEFRRLFATAGLRHVETRHSGAPAACWSPNPPDDASRPAGHSSDVTHLPNSAW